jgi:peptide/nickel transport system substrate-binding protein
MSESAQNHSPDPEGKNALTRRQAFQASLAGVATLGLSGGLAACGGSSSSTSTTTSGGKPVYGGTLKAGLTEGSTSDTVDPLFPLTLPDYCRIRALYDALCIYGSDGRIQLQLAEFMEPNSTATSWTIRVRKGVLFHDGTELTADDVLFTLQRIANPKKPGEGQGEIVALNLAAATKLDKYTLRIPTHAPFSILPGVLAGYYFNIVPVGFDKAHPVGTGPFKFVSFTPGVQSTFVRNPHYWVSGQPYADTLVVTNYPDETSQVNAMLSGQVNLINNLTADQIPTLAGNGHNTLISPGGGWNPFVMRVDQSPWTDVRVRQALRLVVNRPQMLDLVFGGHGRVANDIFGPWDPEYDHSLPQRVQDIDQAKSLLKSAGRSGLSVTLITGDIAQGTLKSAQVLAQQASSAGVTINLQNTNTATYFGPNFTKWNFAQDYWNGYSYLVQVAQVTGPSASIDETHFSNPRYNTLFNQAVATVDEAKQTEIAHEMQVIDYNEGGYIIPFFPPIIDGYASTIHGLVPTITTGVSFNNYDFRSVWLA